MDKMFRPMTKGWQGSKKLMHGNVDKYYTDEWDKDSGRFKLKEGYSHVAHQDAPDAVASVTDRRTKKGSGFETSDPHFIYKKVDTPAPVAPPVAAPEPEPEVVEPQGPPSETLQNAMDTVKAKGPRTTTYTPDTTDADRQALTDSFKQKSYDPEAGIASEKAGDFLADYKLNLNDKIANMRNQFTTGAN